VTRVQYLGSGHNSQITSLPEEKELAAQLNYLNSLNQKAMPLLEADELRKTGNKLTKKEARLASLEQEKPANKKAIADLRSEIQRLQEDCELCVLRIALSTGQAVVNAKAPLASALQTFNPGPPFVRAALELADWLNAPQTGATPCGVDAGVIGPSLSEGWAWAAYKLWERHQKPQMPELTTPKAPDFAEGLTPGGESKVLHNKDGENNHFNGIGRFLIKHPCTATFVDTRPSDSTAETPAYIVTAAHCLTPEVKEGQIVTNMNVTGTFQASYFADSTPIEFQLDSIVHANYRTNDVALIKLKDSLQQVMSKGINPIAIADTAPQNGTAIVVAGAPVRLEPGFLRASACTHKPDLNVDFSKHRHSPHAVKNQCEGVAGGSSGGPVLAEGKIYAVTSSSNRRIKNHNEQPRNIAMSIVQLSECFKDGEFSAYEPNCAYHSSFSIEFPKSIKINQKVSQDSHGHTIPRNWDVSFHISTPFYRYKAIRPPHGCEQPDGYSPAIASQPNSLINIPIGNQLGEHRLCIIGVPSPEAEHSPAIAGNAYALTRKVEPYDPDWDRR